jgi:hypothetical protein
MSAVCGDLIVFSELIAAKAAPAEKFLYDQINSVSQFARHAERKKYFLNNLF